MSAICTADGCIVSNIDGQRTRWVEYFEQLYMMNPPNRQLPTALLQMTNADLRTDKITPSLNLGKEAVARLRGGKVSGVCIIRTELLKAGDPDIIPWP